MARRGEIDLAVSGDILVETCRILHDKLKWSDERVEQARQEITGFARVVTPAERIDVVEADPSDGRILECAVAAGSHVIVSGDHHLTDLGEFRGITIVTVAAFLETVQGRGVERREG
jgi:predicted nucleic acid-binding protein